MRTAYQVITVATKSSAECAASESSASEPESRPTIALAIVNPPEAAIEVSATLSLVSCIFSAIEGPLLESARPPRKRGPEDGFNSARTSIRPALGRARDVARGLRHGFAVFEDQPRAQLGGRRHVRDAADALSGRPHVLPGALLVTELELL